MSKKDEKIITLSLSIQDAKLITKLIGMSIIWCGEEAWKVIKEMNDNIKAQIVKAESERERAEN